jgi:hypothetical protein
VNETAARFIDEIAAFDPAGAEYLREELEAVYDEPRLLDASDRITAVLKDLSGYSIGDRYYEINKIIEAAKPKSARAKWSLPALLAWR